MDSNLLHHLINNEYWKVSKYLESNHSITFLCNCIDFIVYVLITSNNKTQK